MKIQKRKKKIFNLPFNDEKIQSTLDQTPVIPKGEYFIATPKLLELQKKILRGDKSDLTFFYLSLMAWPPQWPPQLRGPVKPWVVA